MLGMNRVSGDGRVGGRGVCDRSIETNTTITAIAINSTIDNVRTLRCGTVSVITGKIIDVVTIVVLTMS